jgi:heat shock protein HslJ
MFKRLFWAALLLALTTMAAAQDVNRVDFNGVGFDFAPEAAASVCAMRIPADPPSALVPGGLRPAHTLIEFYNSEQFTFGALHAFRTADFASYPDFAAQLTALQTILRERPDLAAFATGSARADAPTLPYLPTPAAAQILRAQPIYLDNGVVSGIRYLTVYAQDVAPISGDRIEYTFQGISTDGGTYIAISLRVNAGVLPIAPPETIDFSGISAEDFEAYLTQEAALLNDAPADSFTPALDLLDSIALSLRIEGVTAPTVRPPLEATPSLGALGGTWTLISYGDPSAPTPVLEGTTITLTIDPLGVSGSAGCNRYFGGYVFVENTISFAALGSTRMACAPEIMAQEAAYLRALASTRTFEIVGDTLRIVYDGGALTFERE